ncbi:helix-turn-helix transcriptional regulator [Streptomyces sp. ME02-6987-2C]|uniref:helix-turn-helix domain-containing protein n=1 Tax=unclassified Streptomyces TaxID=2593676 RepID=UPI0029B8C17C|nr:MULTISPECIES: helix-turn-helix transcriptional regulator [unclassified Streptomyces]MDX3345994.1 helix-turn-helix transcriptional regulator [Streptomyces sp. ME02-6979A]MDX3368906.1 helix-turn-helix transcriptional regulator [Streptomyces sp. ME02-6987-2C]MDX3407803.1 helix-turn-helix transcriptional regulator [Streptomyces sp. ME02-6977A]MDX3421760.1 helix-turn-helix transcriptional regulator [Streptomyces sp. ME02-6985-2c]
MLRLDTDLLRARAAKRGDTTHEDIARRAGIERSTVTRIFSGTVPTLVNVTALAWAYDIPLDNLVPKAEPKVEVPA